MTSELSELQHALAQAIRHGTALDQHPAFSALATEHIAGNSRLTPVEQLEIYREQFWLRHTGSLVEDFPGLCGILGQHEWERLVEAYLSAVVADSYTLRDLGSRLADFIAGAEWLPHRNLCLDMARLELAYVEVFDAEDTLPLLPERLAAIPSDTLGDARLVVAPAVRLLSTDYPVADLRRRLRAQHDQEGDQSVAIPEKSPQKLVVYRHDLKLWDMKVSSVAFELLGALAQGLALGAAAESAATSPDAEAELAREIGAWLQEWTRKGLICDAVLS